MQGQGWFRYEALAVAAGAVLLAGAPAVAQVPDGSPQAIAPADLTGIWVAYITEDWRFRMMTAPIGDTASLPLNDEGERVAAAWDPAADVEAGLECRAYGAGGIMRMPTRLRIGWENPTTLMIATDAGEQVRRLHFGGTPPEGTAEGWQGYSVADWEGFDEGQGEALGEGPPTGSLKVVTTNMRAGYVRRNGAPYSAQASMLEYFDVAEQSNGDQWLVLLTRLSDPMYFDDPMMVSSHFKKETDDSGWNPQPCRVTLPVR
jgi:hypothetical protein